jgi:hypothetical protein
VEGGFLRDTRWRTSEEDRGEEDRGEEDRGEEGAVVADPMRSGAESGAGRGMTLESVRGRYSYYTGKTSDIVRQLGFAGIALIWLFRGNSGTHVPRDLLVVAIVIAGALACDLAQYIVGSLVWGKLQRTKEAEFKAAGGLDERVEFDFPVGINTWPERLFQIKWILLIASYVVLGAALASRL